jgi:hypothetical protein
MDDMSTNDDASFLSRARTQATAARKYNYFNSLQWDNRFDGHPSDQYDDELGTLTLNPTWDH